MSNAVVRPRHTAPYGAFVQELREAIGRSDLASLGPFLDGRAGSRCLELLPQQAVKELGAHFTPSRLARRMVDHLSVTSWTRVTVFDPSCGAGDLLLAVAAHLEIRDTVSSTMRHWNNALLGCDISSEFVAAARLRLVALAVARGAELDSQPDTLAALLGNVSVADGLIETERYRNSTHVIMNPPFGKVSVANTGWRNGLATAAALFVDRAARLTTPGTTIVALLPDVLRSGTSYAPWRGHIHRMLKGARPRAIGVFSPKADIDVFIQRYTRRHTLGISPTRKPRSEPSLATIGGSFAVRVGTVVPHRHAEAGPRIPFLHTENAKPWAEILHVSERRRFSGRLFSPPFIAVRRTSRPGDSRRVVATLVRGTGPVAVENHLLVLSPLRGGLSLCRQAMRFLGSASVSNQLDRSMRCRHLTTSSVAELSWQQAHALCQHLRTASLSKRQS